MKLRVIALASILAFSVAPALADGIPAKSWKAFIDDSYTPYHDPDPEDFEGQLYLAAKANKTQAAAIADFGRRMKLAPADAQAYAAIVVDAVIQHEACQGDCTFRPGTPLYDEAVAPVSAPDGRLLLWLGKELNDGDTAAFIRLAWNHPRAVDIFSELYSYNESTAYLSAMLLKLPDDPSAVPLPQLKGSPFSGTPDEMSGLVPAVLEATEARLADTPQTAAWRAAIAQFALEQRLDLGLDHDAVERYFAYPQAVRDQLPYTPAGLTGNDLCRQADASRTFAAHMAVALWAEGRDTEAAALIDHAYPVDWPNQVSDVEYVERLKDAHAPAFAAQDLFGLYIDAGEHPQAETKAQGDCGGRGGGDSLSGTGWLFGAASDIPAVRRLVSGRLDAAGYKDMADWLRRQTVFNDWNNDPAVLSELSDLIPADVLARQPAWKTRIEALKAAEKNNIPTAGPVHVVWTDLPPAWTETPLPAGIKPWADGAGAKLPKGFK
ncbi:MAG: hypothetical protein JF615_09645, partial [Asticcacaulis sp.]|nr:hypothetical protein [Asticcacaulis sp.]